LWFGFYRSHVGRCF